MLQNIEFERGNIRPSECISEGWNLIRDRYGLFLGISLLAMVIGACVPCVSIFLVGPVTVGVFYCFFRQIRGEQVEFGMMFKGFETIVPSIVVGIIQGIPQIISQTINTGVRFANLGEILQKGGNKDYFANDAAIASGIVVVAVIVGLIFMLLAFAWSITFYFALPLLADYPEMEIMEVIKLSARAGWANFGMIFVLSLLQGLVAIAGFLALCVGLFLVMPIIGASKAIAYRQVFPERNNMNNQMFNVPPPPTAYNNQF